MKKKILAVMLIATMTISCVACGSKSNSDTSETSSTKATESTTVSSTEENVKTQDIKTEDLKDLTDKGIISGVKDITVQEGTDVDLNELVYVDKTIVKGVDVDDSKVDYNKAGTYEVIYTITFDGDKLRDFLKSNDLTVSFDTTGNTVVVKTTVTVTVATKEDADAAIANGDTSVVTEETKSEVQKENKAKANDNAVESTPTPTPAQSNSSKKNDNSSGNNGNSVNAGNNSNASNSSSSSSNNGSSNSGGSNTGNGSSSSGNNTSGSGSSGNNSGSTEKPQPHTHNYVELGHTDATCTAAGSITKRCSCGDTITVPNGDALGHDPVTETVTAAWSEDVYDEVYICNDCGQQFATNKDAIRHVAGSDSCYNYYLDNVVVDTINHPAVTRTVCHRCGQQL